MRKEILGAEEGSEQVDMGQWFRATGIDWRNRGDRRTYHTHHLSASWGKGGRMLLGDGGGRGMDKLDVWRDVVVGG